MNESGSKPPSGGRKLLWQGLGGTAAFVLIGLLLTPGIAQIDKIPAEDASKPLASSAHATLADAKRRGETAHWLDESVQMASDSAPTDSGSRAFDCMIGPSEVVDIGSAITGVLDEILVEQSDYVEAGQAVAQLEDSVEQAAASVARARAERTDEIESSQTSLELGQNRLERARKLFKNGVLALDQLQEVEARADLAVIELARANENHRLAKLQLAQALAALEQRTIRSSVSGVVIERLLSAGEVVDEETVVRIAQIDPLRAEAILPSGWYGRMQPGDLASIVPEAPLDQAKTARVAIVDPVIDAASGTFSVQLDLPNGDRSLPAGLRCQVRFSPDQPKLARNEPRLPERRIQAPRAIDHAADQ